MNKIKIAVIAMMGMCLGVNAQNNKIESTGNVGIGTTNTSNSILTVNGDSYTTMRLENDSPNKEASLRFRSKSSSGQTLHSDISSYATGSNQGYLGFKVPANNTVNSGYDMIINHKGYIGIGTTSPNVKLDIYGDNTPVSFRVLGGNTNANSATINLGVVTCYL